MNTRKFLTALACGGALAFALSAAACSSDTPDPFATTDEFCTAKSQALCNGLAKKCGASVDTCTKDQTASCNATAATLVSSGRTYRSGAVQDCLDSINSTYADNGNNVTPDLETATDAVCQRVFTGSKQSGDPCSPAADGTDYECEGALVCDKGICIAKTTVALTTPASQCNNAGQVCDPTAAYCQQQGQTKFCVALNTINMQCDPTAAPCVESLRCLTSVCVARATAGGACTTSSDCIVDAPYCDTVTKKCRPKYESDSSACVAFQ